ncbi:MAG: motility protein A [Chloroflexota bacterium]|jgi:chemotaxis protein MotA|uniref:Motility protein A n=1 Tax=Bellilinea caldifistulae TaxID=360411 RepID=A0A7C4Q2D0_9CHLR|nr:motility protein A [Bellilinea sp.]
MDLATIIGLIGAVIVVVVVMILDGGTPAELFAHPSAIMITALGAIMATTITTSLKIVTKLPLLISKAVMGTKFDEHELIELLVKMADRARRDGLLALEEDSKKITDKFLQKGIMMVVDGVDPAQVRSIMEINIQQMQARHRAGYSFFTAAGGFAPTFGIIGTVMGLISVLQSLDDPNKLAKSIAGAFLATLWGLLSANLIFLPIGAKLKAKSDEEAHLRYMLLEGILSIQAGENPRIVREKLNAYLPPSAVKGEDEKGAEKPAKKAAAAAKEAGA